MKKILPIIICVIAFAACKKNSSSPTVSIVGKWYAVKDVYTVTSKSGVTTPNGTTTFNHTDNMTFNSNNTGIDVQGSSSNNFTYSNTSSNLILTYTGSPAWNIPIKVLTDNSLELYYVTGPDQTDGHSENHDITYSK